jgi:hypothetical protein
MGKYVDDSVGHMFIIRRYGDVIVSQRDSVWGSNDSGYVFGAYSITTYCMDVCSVDNPHVDAFIHDPGSNRVRHVESGPDVVPVESSIKQRAARAEAFRDNMMRVCGGIPIINDGCAIGDSASGIVTWCLAGEFNECTSDMDSLAFEIIASPPKRIAQTLSVLDAAYHWLRMGYDETAPPDPDLPGAKCGTETDSPCGYYAGDGSN